MGPFELQDIVGIDMGLEVVLRVELRRAALAPVAAQRADGRRPGGLGARPTRALGPLEWADEIGLDHIVMILDGLREEHGEERYRTAPLLRRVTAFYEHDPRRAVTHVRLSEAHAASPTTRTRAGDAAYWNLELWPLCRGAGALSGRGCSMSWWFE
jgi:hypothetical protein